MRCLPRRGAILLEVLISIVLFVGAGSFCLTASHSMLNALENTQREQEMIDLARSKLAELELGHITLGDLRGDFDGAVGSFEPDAIDSLGASVRWVFEVEDEPTEYGEHSLVTLTVIEAGDEMMDGVGSREPFSVTIRQLMKLRALDAEAFEEDELLDGLPEPDPLDEEAPAT